MDMKKAQIIVIDGGVNVGKATQADMLMHRIESEGYKVGKMDFPRYHQNTFGHLINDCIAGSECDLETLSPRVAAALYAADRFESKKQIEAWLEEGRTIIFDRYVSSNMLHQGAKIEEVDKREEFFRWVEHVEHEVYGMPRPNLTIYLEVPPAETERLLEYVESLGGHATGTAEKKSLHQAKVAECARYLSNIQDQWKTISCLENNNLRPREVIHEEVYTVVAEHLNLPDAESATKE